MIDLLNIFSLWCKCLLQFHWTGDVCFLWEEAFVGAVLDFSITKWSECPGTEQTILKRKGKKCDFIGQAGGQAHHSYSTISNCVILLPCASRKHSLSLCHVQSGRGNKPQRVWNSWNIFKKWLLCFYIRSWNRKTSTRKCVKQEKKKKKECVIRGNAEDGGVVWTKIT